MILGDASNIDELFHRIFVRNIAKDGPGCVISKVIEVDQKHLSLSVPSNNIEWCMFLRTKVQLAAYPSII